MKRILLAALAAAVLPLAAQAGDLSYTFLQGGYGYSNSNSGHNAHGWSGDGSAAIGQHFQITGGISRSDHDFTGATGNGWSLGGGFHTSISDQTDFIADVGYHQARFDGVSGDVKTWSGEAGVRTALAPRFEGWATAGYAHGRSDIGDISRGSNGRVFGALGGQFKLDKNWGLVGEAQLTNKGQGYFVGPRFSF
jgi:Ax21 family sulfation-dependent quorum factor